MQILIVVGAGLVIYAIFGVLASAKQPVPLRQKIQYPGLLEKEPGKDQKIQRLQSQVAKLESQLEQIKAVSVEETTGMLSIKEKEKEFALELKRREDWVAKAEAELAKVKAENLDLNKKSAVKESELEEEFTKNVNLTRQIQEMEAVLKAKETACRLQEDQLQAQKHQIESQLKGMQDQAATIAELKRKENISEWVPKSEFNQLNEEYTKLEKELEASQERLKSFAVEIAHLRQLIDKKPAPADEVKLTQPALETTNPEESRELEIIKPQETALQGEPQETKELEENKNPENDEPIKQNEVIKENIDQEIKESDPQK